MAAAAVPARMNTLADPSSKTKLQECVNASLAAMSALAPASDVSSFDRIACGWRYRLDTR